MMASPERADRPNAVRGRASAPAAQPAFRGGADAAVEIDLAAPIAGTGWYDVEEHDGRKYRWTGPAAEFDLELPLSELAAVCAIEMIPSSADSFRQFAIWRNGAVVAHEVEKLDHKLVVRFAVPAREPGGAGQKAKYAFRHHSVFRPADAGGTDRRPLGFAVCSIRVEPQPRAAAADHDGARRALVIDDSVPEPDKDAGSNALLQHILALQRLGYSVSFVPADNMARIDPYTAALEALGVACFHRPQYASVADVLRASREGFALAYLHRHGNAARYAAAIRRHSPAARILYNVADLHFLRLRRQGELARDRALCAEADALRETEIAAMHLVDCVLVHSAAEADLLRDLAPEILVRVVPWTIAPRPAPVAAGRPALAFIGGYRHPPNVDAAKWAAASLMPLLRELCLGVELLLVGSHLPPEVAALAAPDVIPLGHVASLDEVFARVRLTIAPLRYGAGLKGKVLDSLAAGIPCVMTTIAAEGLNLPPGLQSLVADAPDAFARRIARLLHDAEDYRAISAAGQSYIAGNYAADRVDRLLQAACDPQ